MNGWKERKKRKIFLKVKFQLINVERMILKKKITIWQIPQ